ncbi:MAG TPA: biopolymer transporter ExbD [Kamptonema sp.]|nr:biopolymer transporter ExbD [Kamptonema sp.]
MRLPEESDDIPPQINIVPMIDVIFAILTFFIMSTLFLTRSEGLPVNLPTATTGETQQQSNQITVTIDKQGNLALNQQPIQLEQIESQLNTLIPSNQKQVLVVINSDESVAHGRVIAVMDKLRSHPGVRIAIATKR